MPITACVPVDSLRLRKDYKKGQHNETKLHKKLSLTTSWRIPFVASIARITQPKVYEEIGIYQASTVNAVAKHFGLTVGVDINPAAGKFVKAKSVEFYVIPQQNKHFMCQRKHSD